MIFPYFSIKLQRLCNEMISAKKHHQVHEQIIKQNKRKEQGHGPTVEIQFCTNCDAHLFAVRHQQAKYSLHYQNIKKRLIESKIGVRKRAVPQNLYKKSPYCPSNVYYRNDNNQLVHFPQVGSFEVYFNGRKIFSKLESLKWPTSESIISEVEKMMGEKKEESGEMQPQAEPQKQEDTVDHENKKGEFRIKNKNDEHLHFRYSIDKRNLFKKPDYNYLNRKSLTARNQSNQESIHRTNNINSSEKRVNEEQLPFTEARNRKDLSDDYVIQMYQKKQAKVEEKPEEHALNFPEIPKKNRRKSGGTNVYLQPIFPKTSVNLQSYSRQRAIFATKIHQQRKSYEVSKNQPKPKPEVDMMRESSKARFNQDCNNLFKDKDLKKIKEATQQNEMKQRQNKKQIAPTENMAKEVPVTVENKIILHSNELIPHSQSQRSVNAESNNLLERGKKKPQEISQKQQSIDHKIAVQKDMQEIPLEQAQLNLKINKDSHIDAIEHIEPQAVDIDKIATTKTIHQVDKNKLKSQENAYEEEFQQEEEKVPQEAQEKYQQNYEKQQTEKKVQVHKQPETVQPQPQNQAEYQNEEFQQEKEKEEKQEKEEKLIQPMIEQAEAFVEMINQQVEQKVANIP